MRSPASVADAAGSAAGNSNTRLVDLARRLQRLPQHGDLSNAAHHLKARSVRPLKRNARRVIPTVLQLRQPAGQNGSCAGSSGIAHNSTHSVLSNNRRRAGHRRQGRPGTAAPLWRVATACFWKADRARARALFQCRRIIVKRKLRAFINVWLHILNTSCARQRFPTPSAPSAPLASVHPPNTKPRSGSCGATAKNALQLELALC